MKKPIIHLLPLLCLSFSLLLFNTSLVNGQVIINELVSSNQQGLSDEDGDFPDWIELYNAGKEPIDLTGFGISDDPEAPFQWEFPEIELAAGAYYLLFASNKNRTNPNNPLHLNFKLSTDGETVVITHPDGTVMDSVSYPHMNPDESYGRLADEPENWVIFTETTPMEVNSADGFAKRLTIPVLTHAGGFFDGSVIVDFADSTSENVYYTTDGSIPGQSDLVFTPPYTFDETTVLRLRAIQDGRLSSDVETYTYFIDVHHELPVISLSTEPDLLWSDDQGIYVRGNNGVSGNCEDLPVNWNQDWEIPAHIEFYEQNQSLGFSSNIGTKIFGGCSRQNPQKSLAVFFRGEYGNPELEYRLFEEKDIDTFQAFILRNGGNDFGRAHLRDAMMTTLIEDHTKLDYQAYRPAVVYLNGEYWGIHNIREKINEHFVASNHNLDADDIDLIENNGDVKHGESDAYNAMMETFENADMETEAGYQSVQKYLDVESFIDYQVSEIFFANQDWPGNNVRYWRERREGAKFSWIIYDTDFGFNLYGQRPPDVEMINFATDGSHDDPGYWPNPAWSTYLFRKLLENESFQHAFVNRFADLLNTSFSENHIINVIDSLAHRIEPEMDRHLELLSSQDWLGYRPNWENQINVLKGFGENRQGYIASQIINYFNIKTLSPVTIEASAGGKVRVNRLIPDSYSWAGEYFGGVPLTITALPDPGYRFTGWSGSSSSTSRSITVQAEEEPELKATFEELQAETSEIVINEIMYNAPDEEDPEDWIELYNPYDFAMNIGGWIIKDDDDEHAFMLPENTLIAETGYLVVSQNIGSFQEIYGARDNVVGSMDFGLGGGGDQVRIYDQNGVLVDSLEYTDEAPWPLEADGEGYSLVLTDPLSDNSLAENWAASAKPGGTPGNENRIATSSEEELAFPSSITLEQNYPNPFNPNTNITYHLTENTLINLEVFDVLGRKVSTLVSGRKTAGTHQATFDAGNLASGVYVYRLQAGEAVLIKKMLLAK